jgi:hypothetical protein
MTGELETATAVASLIVAGVALWTAWRARRQPGDLREAVKALSTIAQTQQAQLETLARSVAVNASLQERTQALRQQEILIRQQRQNWDLWVGIAKALGWAYDRGLIGGDDEDDED